MIKLMSKKKSSIINMLTMISYQMFTVVFGFIIPKLLLTSYGVDIHGYTSTVTNIMNYVALLNAGLGTAALQALYKPLANRDNRKISAILNAVDRFYVKTGCFYIIAVIAISTILPFIISDQIPSKIVFTLMIVMGSTSTLECFIYSKYRVLLQADQCLYIVTIVDMLALLIRYVLQIFLITKGFSIIFIQAVPIIIVFLRAYLLSRYVKSNYTNLDKEVPPDYSALSKRWSAFIHQIAGLVVYNADVMLLTIFNNLVYVSIYSVYNLVFSHLYTLLTNVFSKSTLASFGQLLNEDKRKSMIDAYEKYEFLYYLFITILYSFTAVLILSFVSIYTMNIQGVKYVDIKLACLFVIIGIANNLRVPGQTIIDAAGNFKETQWRAVTEAIINIAVSLILVKPMGIYGVLVGTICSFAYRTTDIIFYSNRNILKRKVTLTIMRSIRVVVLIYINILVCNALFASIDSSWLEWIVHGIKCSVVIIPITLCTNILVEPELFKVCLKYFLKRSVVKDKAKASLYGNSR